MGVEEQDDTEGLEKLKKSKQEEPSGKDSLPPKKEEKIIKNKMNALLPEKQKKPNAFDSLT
jgi:hypothetical protein